ncbi:hypothetical protein SAMN05660909_03210 [Chitinophaga terrae (ex Kim and Jung 2007)]|jgi:hypothetical protein|uniref:Uncharacterized protein n=1 Tax=Chitinophaga terrae (ex Kim and Jung 2007) TaxID=408074 RepID=A0A1H4DMQ8_9BACT|nr:hypothetical protein [Chitinophaga terrae (ex Kim and Jung 2007)]MDQ0107836.1 hypothetical protein [Chitinophaga terrae (ex Kim and Jung 2007)]GEP91010.1 hypothetical protein CTE07_26550 [Chitinophaga terrae (ex Kim and Jung 2007)]SEA74024.1 hypothetical protein SAMN05660909_03210 [Chitinophaga terrae (ex Kim and Jung 2007)]
MNTTDITIYIDNKPYRFHVKVDQENDSTTYSVSSAEEANAAADFIPDHLEFNVDGSIQVKERLKTVEQEQIARLIWQEILDKMNP